MLAFFGPNGDKELALPQWASFIGNLHDEILRLEFEHYDHNNTVRLEDMLMGSPAS